MRDIKFRVWVPKRGRRAAYMSQPFAVGKPTTLFDGDVVTQFTGLNDSKGRDIYEGDILCLEEMPFGSDGDVRPRFIQNVPVEFKEAGFIVTFDFDDYDMTTVGWAMDHWDNAGFEYRVIGNIYENPELLEAK